MSKKINQVKNFFKDRDKKPYFQMLYEASQCWVAEKELPRHYFTRLLYKKGVANYLDYMGVKKSNSLAEAKVFHNSALTPLIDNKLCFSLYLENQPGIRVPKTLGFNINNSFYISGQEKRQFLRSSEEILAFFMRLLDSSPSQSVFVKPIEGGRGKDCFIVTGKKLRGLEAGSIFPLLLKGNFLFQEVVAQHRDIGQIYNHSLNTVRVDSYMDPQGNVTLISALMRFGTGVSVVDNISAGGFFVPIDMASGRFKQQGYQLLEYGGKVFSEHPDTGFIFEGFAIPYFEELKEMLKAAVMLIPDRLIGWDVAVSETGPVIIEGNQAYSLRMSEMAYGGYNNHPVYQEILKRF